MKKIGSKKSKRRFVMSNKTQANGCNPKFG